MTLKNTLKNYFNSGSPDKRTKRRIGGLVIAITAVALVAALLVLTVSSIASAIANKKANAAGEGAPVSAAIETVSGNIDDIKANLNSLVTLVDGSGLVLTKNDVKTFAPENRTNIGDAKNPAYAYGISAISYKIDALIIEAYIAFDKMACDFFAANNTKIIVTEVYNTEGSQVTATFANALTVRLHTSDEEGTNNYPHTIYGDARYNWIYQNAANYGFVRVSNEEGEKDVFRYVGVVHAKAMGANKTISEYIEELKGMSAEAPKVVKSYTSKIDGAKVSEAKIYYVPYGESYALPNPDKFTFTASNVGDGYVITCFAK